MEPQGRNRGRGTLAVLHSFLLAVPSCDIPTQQEPLAKISFHAHKMFFLIGKCCIPLKKKTQRSLVTLSKAETLGRLGGTCCLQQYLSECSVHYFCHSQYCWDCARYFTGPILRVVETGDRICILQRDPMRNKATQDKQLEALKAKVMDLIIAPQPAFP